MVLWLTLVFVVSGAAGLVYESIWSRYLGLFLGHGALAQVLVIAIFLGGMSAGALVAARRCDRMREPLFGYAIVEAIVGLLGLTFHGLYLSVTGFTYAEILPRLGGPVAITSAKWAIASLLILPQSVLLGATFPLMAAGVLRRMRSAPGRVLGTLYFANSLGAAAGVLIAGFVLIRIAGLPGTVTAAAILNLLGVAAVLVALRLERRASRATRVAPEAEPPPPPATPLTPGIVRLLLITSFFTAVASFAYEIAWIRMLSLVLGSATHSFELMLSAFVLGLALGSFWIRHRADRYRDPLRALGVVQWTMGVLAVSTLPVYLSAFPWTAHLMSTFGRTDAGYQAFHLARYGICLAVMLPATFCAGVTLPLITRALLAGGAGERAIGQVYGVNTLGSIVGAAAAGLVLLPGLGAKGLLIAGAIVDVAIGVVLLAWPMSRSSVDAPRWWAWRARPASLAVFAAICAGLAIAVIATSARFDGRLLASGVYRSGRATAVDAAIEFHHDGRTATVTVKRDDRVGAVTLLTNGKPDASVGVDWRAGLSRRRSLSNDESTQVLLSLVTLAHAPEARQAAVIGQGSGVSSHVLLGSPALERLVTVEIEPEMVRASRAFFPLNRRAFEDPRSRVVIDDAKSYFSASRQRFDLILSEPSNPWVSGVSNLFTTEFYGALTHHLAPGGVFGQWLHLYEIDDDLVLRVLAALHEHFAHYELFLVSDGDMLVVATNRPEGLSPDWSVVRAPGIAADLTRLAPLTPASFEAMRIADRRALEPVIEFGPRGNSDFFPVLDLAAERARYLGLMANGFLHMNEDRHSLISATMRRGPGLEAPVEVPTPGIPALRAMTLSAGLQAAAAGTPPPSLLRDPRGRLALQSRATLDAFMAHGKAPVDWRLWVEAFLAVERDLHGAAAGAVDEAFYAEVDRYLDRANAPAEARAAVAFTRGLGVRDYAAAARAADTLIPAAVGGATWIPGQALLDGTVTAKIMMGDRRGAHRAHRALRPLAERPSNDLRSRLVYAYTMLERSPEGGPLGATTEP